MAREQWSSGSRRLGENVALLSLLSPVPSRPSVNTVSAQQHGDDLVRSFSFDRECCLAGSLAFLAGLSDNPNHVIALSVEEASAPKAIKVVIAINKQRPRDGEDVLGQIKLGFETIFNILSRARHDSSGHVEGEVLSAIVSMMRCKILLRIGSNRPEAPFTRKQKALFGNIIQTVINAVRQQAETRRRPDTESFLEKSVNLKRSLDALEICRPGEVNLKLREVVTTASRLDRSMDISHLLRDIPPKDLDSSTREGFVRRLGKIARYRECSWCLYKTAKSIDLFDNATVVPVSLGEKYFARSPARLNHPSLSACVSRCKGNSSLNLQGMSEPVVTGNFTTKAKNAFNQSKIHAEIQVLAHYELYQVERAPRVICSSKDACYLCNAFIGLHGKFHIPASHGRLYPAWRLPELQAFHDLQIQLNLSLESQILSQSRNRQAVITNLPNESTLMPFSTSLSTILTFAGSGHEERPPFGSLNNPDQAMLLDTGKTCFPAADPSQRSARLSPAPGGESCAAAAETNKPAESPPPGPSGDPIETTKHPSQSGSSTASTPKPSPLVAKPEVAALICGQPTTLTADESSHAPRGYAAGGLTIFPQLPRRRAGLAMTIEWLADEEARRLDASAVDARSMPVAVDVDSGSRDCVLIACGRVVVRIRV